jgi:hypothetical protein
MARYTTLPICKCHVSRLPNCVTFASTRFPGSGVHQQLRMLDTHKRTAKVNFARSSTSINPLTYFSKQMIFRQIPSLTNGPPVALILPGGSIARARS